AHCRNLLGQTFWHGDRPLRHALDGELRKTDGRPLKALAKGLAIACALAGVSALAGTPPPAIPHGTQDYRNSDAGTYRLDPNHTAVLARVSHLGFSFSVFRFGRTQATLQWNPDDPVKCHLTAKVETASIATPVKGFARLLSGNAYLKSAQFPEAT